MTTAAGSKTVEAAENTLVELVDRAAVEVADSSTAAVLAVDNSSTNLDRYSLAVCLEDLSGLKRIVQPTTMGEVAVAIPLDNRNRCCLEGMTTEGLHC